MKGLIADIGATNARFARADMNGIYDERVFKCADFPGLLEAAQAYLAQSGGGQVAHAAVAVAGPVDGDRFTLTNHPWDFSVAEVRRKLGLKSLRLLNDFEAVALSVPHLKEERDYHKVFGAAPRPQASIAVLGAGTGLGVGSLVWDGGAYRAVPGEGGHVTAPAKTPREFAVLQWLIARKYRHVSAERVCSGKGLENIYNALRGLDGRGDLPELGAPDISARALKGECSLCAEALAMMTGFLGSVAGNLALTLGARGGVYIAGGIVQKLGDYFARSRFHQEFLGKGRFEEYLAPIPVYVVTHDFPAFVGLQADLVRHHAA